MVPFNKIGLSLTVASTLALSACDENGEFAFPVLGQSTDRTETSDAPTGTQSVQLVERDVEAPDAFQVTESGLWDGRPPLGGVWVAHPDVTEPERVIIRNQANGAFVIGALFRRERDNPGPSLQVSSDAASALQMLAGSPAQLQVTALRREEVAQTPEAQPNLSPQAILPPRQSPARHWMRQARLRLTRSRLQPQRLMSQRQQHQARALPRARHQHLRLLRQTCPSRLSKSGSSRSKRTQTARRIACAPRVSCPLF